MRQLVFIALLFAQLAVCAQKDDSVVLLHGSDRQLTLSEIRQKRAIEAWENLSEARRSYYSAILREAFTPWKTVELIDTGLRYDFNQRTGTDTVKVLFTVQQYNDHRPLLIEGYYVLRWVHPNSKARYYKVMKMLPDGTVVRFLNAEQLNTGYFPEDCLMWDKKPFSKNYFILSAHLKDWR